MADSPVLSKFQESPNQIDDPSMSSSAERLNTFTDKAADIGKGRDEPRADIASRQHDELNVEVSLATKLSKWFDFLRDFTFAEANSITDTEFWREVNRFMKAWTLCSITLWDLYQAKTEVVSIDQDELDYDPFANMAGGVMLVQRTSLTFWLKTLWSAQSAALRDKKCMLRAPTLAATI